MPAVADQRTSTQRPVPLVARDDLRVVRMRDRGAGSWVVKDPIALKYHRLQPEQHRVLALLDGKRSLDDIRQVLTVEFPTVTIDAGEVQRLIVELHTRGLLTSLRPGRGLPLLEAERKERRKRLWSALTNFLYLRLPGFDPTPVLRWMLPLLGWTFAPWAVALAGGFVVWSLLLVLVEWGEFSRRLPEFQQFFGWPNLVWLWLMIGVTKLVHEFGHALCCRRLGAECHEIGVMLLLFSPTMYTDATDSWMLRSKWKRIAVASAGMYFESILAAAAVLVWWNTGRGLINALALNVVAVSSVTTVVFNANPLMRYDGYYILSDWLEIPNMRQRSDRVLHDTFARTCLGLDPPPDPFLPEDRRRWLFVYGVAAGVYRLMVLFGVTLFLYGVLKPWGLETLAVVMTAVTIGGMLFRGGRQLVTTIRGAGPGEVNPTRVSLTIAGVFGLLMAALVVPLPLHVESTFQVQPHDQRDVYVITPGELVEIAVQPGDRVKAGDVLVRLSNPEKDDARRKLDVRKRMDEMNVEVAYALDDDNRETVAREKLAGTIEELKDYERQLDVLVLRAPCDGVVVAAPPKPEPRLDHEGTTLNPWHGTPLDRHNLGCWLDRQTHVLSIAPDHRVDAILYVDQADRSDVRQKQSVELKFDHLPEATFAGEVSDVALRERSSAPAELSQKQGGDLTTVTDRRGREQLTSVAYQVTVVLEDEAGLLQPGMKGKARFAVARRSAFDWLWRKVRQTIHFRL